MKNETIPNQYDGPRVPAKKLPSSHIILDYINSDNAAEINAGIELGGRRIVPHSSWHSLASLLEKRGESIRHIQELLGHSDLKTTKIYLHSTEKTIRDIGRRISEVMENRHEEEKILDFKVS